MNKPSGAAMRQRILGVLLVLIAAASAGSRAAEAQVSAAADVYSTAAGDPLVVAPPGVLGNDASADSLAAILVAGPMHGEVLLRPDGSFDYTPAEGFEGRDSLTYVAHSLKPITFVVDSTATTLTLDAELSFQLGSASDRTSSSVGGSIVAYLLPGAPPFLEVHLAEVELVLLQSLHLEFSTFLGSLLADVSPGGMKITMLESGGSVAASGTSFDQPDNVMQVTATALLQGTGSLSSFVPAGDQDIVVDDEVALAGDIRLDAGGGGLRLEIPLDLRGAFELPDADVDLAVTGTIYASAPLVPAVESEETVVRIDVGEVGTAITAEELPDVAALRPVYPNPFNHQAAVTFSLRKASEVRLSVYDVTGREVRVLAAGGFAPGTHDVEFEASGLPGGVYFVRLESQYGLEVARAVFTR